MYSGRQGASALAQRRNLNESAMGNLSRASSGVVVVIRLRYTPAAGFKILGFREQSLAAC